MLVRNGVMAICAALALAACSNDPAQREANLRDLECAGATALGTGVGGLVGNQFGGGSGRTIATVAGGATGAVLASSNAAACK